MSRVIIIAGPNGAGKTTFAREFLPNEGECLQFVNADLIAAGVSPFVPASADVTAGRIMLRRLQELSSELEDFALETTLSGKWLVGHIQEWRQSGYYVELYYLRLSSPEAAIARVAKRVSEGGHYVPDAVVRRRFYRSWEFFENKYRELVDDWYVYDMEGRAPILINSKPEDQDGRS